MSDDLTRILKEWPLGVGPNVRRIVGDDGRIKIQIRICVETYHGILQFERDGRPDGARPYGYDFALDYYEELSKKHVGDKPFQLSHEQAEELFAEGLMTYHRYIVLLQMEDYDGVIRDTERNMRLFRFLHTYAAEEEDRNRNEKWWPYILRIHCTARALKLASEKRYDEALAVVAEGRRTIEDLESQLDEIFITERKRSLAALDELEKRLRKEAKKLDPIEQLEEEKAEAIRQENYERAAELRDQIEALKRNRLRAKASQEEG